MALEALQRAPVLEDFTLLADHEQQTPGSFFDAKPVLHLRAPAATVKVSSEQWEAQPLLHTLAAPPPSVAVDGTVLVADVDVWVTSR
jgi:nucleotide-sensitive chloride channel 1A